MEKYTDSLIESLHNLFLRESKLTPNLNALKEKPEEVIYDIKIDVALNVTLSNITLGSVVFRCTV